MGAFAEAVQDRMRDRLSEVASGHEWVTEHYVGGTPVDVAGLGGDALVAVELEWRRADPADNTAKLFRHLSEGALDDYGRVVVCQVFTGYYDLASGGVSSKRKNAEFVGEVAGRALDRVRYHAVEFDLDPPKRGADRPEGWRQAADEAADAVAERLRE